MQKQFFTTLKRRSHRERFYSSMNYDEYCDVYGPPSPFFKPQEDPVEDIPLLDLELPAPSPDPTNEVPTDPLPSYKMDTILEIDGSENFTQNMQRSPKNQFLLSNRKSRVLLGEEEGVEVPKRVRIRMRSQSDNSQYLIFNFLERVSEKGRKRIKLQ